MIWWSDLFKAKPRPHQVLTQAQIQSPSFTNHPLHPLIFGLNVWFWSMRRCHLHQPIVRLWYNRSVTSSNQKWSANGKIIEDHQETINLSFLDHLRRCKDSTALASSAVVVQQKLQHRLTWRIADRQIENVVLQDAPHLHLAGIRWVDLEWSWSWEMRRRKWCRFKFKLDRCGSVDLTVKNIRAITI